MVTDCTSVLMYGYESSWRTIDWLSDYDEPVMGADIEIELQGVNAVTRYHWGEP